MLVTSLEIPEVKLIKPTVFKDKRGFFVETYNQDRYKEHGISEKFVQDNHSFSTKNILRGLHFQKAPKAQVKLVQVIEGEIFDVAVDIRPESPTRGKWVSAILSGENKHQLLIPQGFAHGLLILSETAHVSYKCSDTYSKDHEAALLWNDPDLNIDWPLAQNKLPILSEKDKQAMTFHDFIRA